MRDFRAPLEYSVVSSQASVESLLISQSTSLVHLRQHVRATLGRWVSAQTEERLSRRFLTLPINSARQQQLVRHDSPLAQPAGRLMAAVTYECSTNARWKRSLLPYNCRSLRSRHPLGNRSRDRMPVSDKKHNVSTSPLLSYGREPSASGNCLAMRPRRTDPHTVGGDQLLRLLGHFLHQSMPPPGAASIHSTTRTGAPRPRKKLNANTSLIYLRYAQYLFQDLVRTNRARATALDC